MYGALAVVGTMGPWYLLLLLGHCVGLYVASLLRQPWLCLGLGMASLASFKLDPLISWQVRDRGGGAEGTRQDLQHPSPPPKPLPPTSPSLSCAFPAVSKPLTVACAWPTRWSPPPEQGRVQLALLSASTSRERAPNGRRRPHLDRGRDRTSPRGKLGGLPRDKGHLVSWRPVLSPPERVCNRHF